MYGEGDDAGRPEAAMCAGLHTHGKSVEARLHGTVVVHGVREEVSNVPHRCCALMSHETRRIYPKGPSGSVRAT